MLCLHMAINDDVAWEWCIMYHEFPGHNSLFGLRTLKPEKNL